VLRFRFRVVQTHEHLTDRATVNIVLTHGGKHYTPRLPRDSVPFAREYAISGKALISRGILMLL